MAKRISKKSGIGIDALHVDLLDYQAIGLNLLMRKYKRVTLIINVWTTGLRQIIGRLQDHARIAYRILRLQASRACKRNPAFLNPGNPNRL